jgi:hypothetical protein
MMATLCSNILIGSFTHLPTCSLSADSISRLPYRSDDFEDRMATIWLVIHTHSTFKLYRMYLLPRSSNSLFAAYHKRLWVKEGHGAWSKFWTHQ